MELIVAARNLARTVDVTGRGLSNCAECPCDSEHADNGAFECVLKE